MAPMDLRIAHLYPDLMNLYGDRGNILSLVNRALWRGIEVQVSPVSIGDPLDPGAFDLFFFGGGQDQQQEAVSADLQGDKGRRLIEGIAGGAAALCVCGGYQLLGKYYRPFEGPDLPGIGVLDAWTVAGRKRCIGNVVVELDRSLAAEAARDSAGATIVGFENHSGKTYLGPGCKPLGRVVVGFGNNAEDGFEGAVSGKVIGTYLHGSLLPKNPHLTDLLLRWALSRRHGSVALPPLDDGVEWRAHEAAVARARVAR